MSCVFEACISCVGLLVCRGIHISCHLIVRRLMTYLQRIIRCPNFRRKFLIRPRTLIKLTDIITELCLSPTAFALITIQLPTKISKKPRLKRKHSKKIKRRKYVLYVRWYTRRVILIAQSACQRRTGVAPDPHNGAWGVAKRNV